MSPVSGLLPWLTRSLAVRCIAVALRCYAATWTYRIAGWPAFRKLIDGDEPVVGGMYHGRQLGLWGYISKPQCRQWSVMVSRSQDGNFMSALLEALGWKTIRGSSGRGGAGALKDAALGMKNGDTTGCAWRWMVHGAPFMCQRLVRFPWRV